MLNQKPNDVRNPPQEIFSTSGKFVDQYQHTRARALVSTVSPWRRRPSASAGGPSDGSTTRPHTTSVRSLSFISARALNINTRARARSFSTVSPWRRRPSASAGGPSDGSTTGHHWASSQMPKRLPPPAYTSVRALVHPSRRERSTPARERSFRPFRRGSVDGARRLVDRATVPPPDIIGRAPR
jgi:hypothetical protein